MVSQILPLVMMVSFLAYEIVERSVERDRAYPEIREWCIGFSVGVLVLLAKSLLIG